MKEETEIREQRTDQDGSGSGDERRTDRVNEAAGVGGDEGREGSGDAVVAELDELRDELQSMSDQHLRLAAEFDNYRKRNERERQALATRLQANLVASLLDVLDDLQRVASSGDDVEADSVLEGVRLVEKKFSSVLEAAGLEPMDAEGEPFDPEVMEALMTVPTDDPDRDHRVADVFQRGYRFRDAMVRPARVRVWQYDESGTGE